MIQKCLVPAPYLPAAAAAVPPAPPAQHVRQAGTRRCTRYVRHCSPGGTQAGDVARDSDHMHPQGEGLEAMIVWRLQSQKVRGKRCCLCGRWERSTFPPSTAQFVLRDECGDRSWLRHRCDVSPCSTRCPGGCAGCNCHAGLCPCHGEPTPLPGPLYRLTCGVCAATAAGCVIVVMFPLVRLDVQVDVRGVTATLGFALVTVNPPLCLVHYTG